MQQQLNQQHNSTYIPVAGLNAEHLAILPHHTTPQPFYGPFSRTILVSRCQKKTSGLYGARED